MIDSRSLYESALLQLTFSFSSFQQIFVDFHSDIFIQLHVCERPSQPSHHYKLETTPSPVLLKYTKKQSSGLSCHRPKQPDTVAILKIAREDWT